MKTLNLAIVVSISGLCVAACRSPVYVEKDASADLRNYHSYTWVETRANENDKTQRATAYADLGVRNAVNAELAREGWREVTNNPDVLLSYDVLIGRSTQQQNDPVYTQPFTRMYYNPYTRRWGSTIYYPSQFIGYQTYEVPVRKERSPFR